MVRREIDQASELGLRAEVKRQLRRRMQGLRRVLPVEARAARSEAIGARLLELPQFTAARTIVAYHATAREADPGSALLAAERAGKTLGLPRVGTDGSLQLLCYHSGDPLEHSALDIAEPLPSATALADAAVDLIIVPALAFDDRGHRVGYGHGYYDRLLPRLQNAFKVVIGYDFQRIMETPQMPGDEAVNCVVTDLRTVVIAADAR